MGPLSPGHESRSASAEISGVSGPIRRMGRTTNPLIDAIAAARWVPRLRRDTVIASSCISVPRPVVHRSRGTRPGRRRPRAIQLSASPYPGLVSTRPQSGKITGRMSPQAPAPYMVQIVQFHQLELSISLAENSELDRSMAFGTAPDKIRGTARDSHYARDRVMYGGGQIVEVEAHTLAAPICGARSSA